MNSSIAIVLGLICYSFYLLPFSDGCFFPWGSPGPVTTGRKYTVNDYRQKLCFFSTCICYKLCSKSLLKELHRIKLLHIEIIDNAGWKKTKLLPIEFICTSHNSEGQSTYRPNVHVITKFLQF